MVTFKEYGSRTATPSRPPRRCSSRGAVTEFPLNDQEILLRHLHKTARDYVADYQDSSHGDARPHLGRVVTEERPTDDRHRFPPSSPTSSRSPTGRCATEAERYAKRLAQLDGRAPGVLRRRVPAPRGRDRVPRRSSSSTASRRGRRDLLWLCYSLVNVSFPVEVWRQPGCPTAAPPAIDAVVEPAI